METLVAKVLNFEVSVYLSWLWLVSLFSISVTLALQSVFLTKLLILGILFSTVINAVFVAKLLISGILFPTVVNVVFVAKLLILGILFSNWSILVMQSEDY